VLSALLFTQRYSCIVPDIIERRVNSVVGYLCNVFEDYCLKVANCLHKLGLIMVRDNFFKFSGVSHMSSCDLTDIIANVCTC